MSVLQPGLEPIKEKTSIKVYQADLEHSEWQENIEWPIRMLKNEHCVNLHNKNYRNGPE